MDFIFNPSLISVLRSSAEGGVSLANYYSFVNSMKENVVNGNYDWKFGNHYYINSCIFTRLQRSEFSFLQQIANYLCEKNVLYKVDKLRICW